MIYLPAASRTAHALEVRTTVNKLNPIKRHYFDGPLNDGRPIESSEKRLNSGDNFWLEGATWIQGIELEDGVTHGGPRDRSFDRTLTTR